MIRCYLNILLKTPLALPKATFRLNPIKSLQDRLRELYHRGRNSLSPSGTIYKKKILRAATTPLIGPLFPIPVRMGPSKV